MKAAAALQRLVEGGALSREEMRETMRGVMTGEATPAQIAGLLIALRMKGETVDELAGAVEVMRELVTPVPIRAEFRRHLIDTCGTGGDRAGLFNISTAAAFVVAAAGGAVAKHGNRSMSGTTGSADVLESAGVRLDLSAEAVADCVHRTGVGFIFAPAFHTAMKHAIGPRREMGVRTIFNLLGPLTNPAGATRQVIGVFDARWLRPVAEVLLSLGSEHVMVVHSEDGLDEISIAGRTHYAELKNGRIETGTLAPATLGVATGPIEKLKVNGSAESLVLVRSALEDREGPAREIVALNAAAALYVAGLAEDLRDGLRLARETIRLGKAAEKLEELAQVSRSMTAVAA